MTATLERTAPPDPAPGSASRPWWRRPALIACCLLACYLLVARFTDPGGYLGTDTGGKVATLEAMTDRGDLDPDLGYWAAELDPDGSLYPMWGTVRYEDDRWVNVTTLPMLYVSAPLYRVAGYDGALLIPMLGAVFTALAAGALARRLSAHSDGAVATWIIGLASPVVVYALDFWEHAPGLALMAWALVAATDVVERRPSIALAAASGLGFGLAATMRQEALVYGFVTGLVLVALLLVRRGIVASVGYGGVMAVSALAPLAMNAWLESSVLGESVRTERNAGAATRLGSDLAVRAEEALITAAVPFEVGQPLGYLAAALLIAGLVALTAAVLDGGNVKIPAAMVAIVYLLLLIEVATIARSFVPGMLATTPLAGAGLVVGLRLGAARLPYLVAVGSLPLVWMVQYTGGAGPQWAGRYILLSGFALAVVAVAGLERWSPPLLAALAAVGLAVTATGVLWTVERTTGFSSATGQIATEQELVLVWSDPFLAREAGPRVIESQWLVAYTDELRSEATSVVDAAGHDRFGYVNRERNDVPDMPGFEPVDESYVPVLDGYRFRVTTFERVVDTASSE